MGLCTVEHRAPAVLGELCTLLHLHRGYPQLGCTCTASTLGVSHPGCGGEHRVWCGKPHRVANAYAPQDDTVRPQFLQDLTDEINDHTILALDANCVPDTTPTTSAPSTASQ
jgi:hypothetical protein